MIKELREALTALYQEAVYQATNNGWDIRYEIPKAVVALAKTEHHPQLSNTYNHPGSAGDPSCSIAKGSNGLK